MVWSVARPFGRAAGSRIAGGRTWRAVSRHDTAGDDHAGETDDDSARDGDLSPRRWVPRPRRRACAELAAPQTVGGYGRDVCRRPDTVAPATSTPARAMMTALTIVDPSPSSESLSMRVR